MKKNMHYLACLYFFLIMFSACKNKPETSRTSLNSDSLSGTEIHLPENALKELQVTNGLEVRTMATEPMLKNPTNIDVDERGRVWVTEAYNYRPGINGNPTNPQGDRIIILEDTNSDGRFDKTKVFYQGPEINAPLGICVLGKRILVSQSPYVWAFYDDNGDDKADRKEIVFEGIGGEQHDHGVHSFIFGPDGKLYFTFGNEGKTLKDKNGKVVRDQDGDEISHEKYRMGMVFRCNPDGSHVECLGQNFRNNYEAAVDSYGTIWQSDNDDDGNRGVRINYVMEYGNYGYTDEITGAGWQANRTNIEDSIPLRHWHLNDPGVVPNLLQTGAGSPAGMVVYEGSLLPEQFHNQLIHCDAGPNVVRAYSLKRDGAGYSASIINILKSEKDQWFRPVDVCVAPDGSVIIADWYDPGVGGHQAGDQQRGRIYRVATAGSKYNIPSQDYSTPAGAVTALQNPNLAVRQHAWMVLHEMGDYALPELEKLWKSSSVRMRARAFWILVKLRGKDKQYIQQAIKDNNPDLRILALRAARQVNSNVAPLVAMLVNDPDPGVRRECALALRHNLSRSAPGLWATLAAKHNGKDRWYLEALGIGADRQWDKFFTAYLQKVKDTIQNPGFSDIIWRARTELSVPYLASFASDKNTDMHSRLRYFRAFDFNPGPSKSKLLLKMIEENTSNDTQLTKLVLRHLDLKTVRQSPIAQKALLQTLRSIERSPEYIELVRRYAVSSENPVLLELAIEKPEEEIGRDAAGLLLQLHGESLAQRVIDGTDSFKIVNLLTALSKVGTKESLDILQQVVLSKNFPVGIRGKAAGSLGKSWSGEERALGLLRNKKVPEELVPAVVSGMKNAWRKYIYDEATSYLPGGGNKTGERKLPTLKELLVIKSNAANGRAVFKKTCAVCHQVNGEGFDFGPKLTEIGSKLPKEGQLEAIFHPSAGISFGYEGWELKMKDGSTQTGIISSKTETDIDLKYPGGTIQHVKTSDVKSLRQLKESLMPEGLHQTMSNQELADLLEYLSTLKKKG